MNEKTYNGLNKSIIGSFFIDHFLQKYHGEIFLTQHPLFATKIAVKANLAYSKRNFLT